jgi:hypothetical protein
MARQHAWESGTSWVMDGAVRFLAGSDPAAARLRDSFVFKLFPMADPDGVARGGVRFNANGYDLNRNWDTIDPKLMPETAALRKAVLDWTDGGRRIDLFLSLHNTNSDYLEGPLSAAGPDYRQIVERFAALLSKNTFFDTKARDWPPGEVARGRMDACQGLFHDRAIPTLLLEQNVQTNATLHRPASVEDYRLFGAQLLLALGSAVGGRTASENLLKNPGFATDAKPMPPGWTVWAARDALRPRTRVITAADGNLLSLEATRPTAPWPQSTSSPRPQEDCAPYGTPGAWQLERPHTRVHKRATVREESRSADRAPRQGQLQWRLRTDQAVAGRTPGRYGDLRGQRRDGLRRGMGRSGPRIAHSGRPVADWFRQYRIRQRDSSTTDYDSSAQV